MVATTGHHTREISYVHLPSSNSSSQSAYSRRLPLLLPLAYPLNSENPGPNSVTSPTSAHVKGSLPLPFLFNQVVIS